MLIIMSSRRYEDSIDFIKDGSWHNKKLLQKERFCWNI